MKEKVRGYVLIPEDTAEVINPACLLIRYIPIFMWNILYLRSEGVEDISIVGENAEVTHIAKLMGVRVILPSEFKEEKVGVGEADYVIKLSGGAPFHKAGMVEAMIRMCEDAKRVVTANAEAELIRVDTFLNNAKVMVLPSPYDLIVRDHRGKMEAEHIPTLHRGQGNLLPNKIKKVVVVQDVDEYERNYSDFIDSCDLVVRCNLMDNYLSGMYGKRIDILLLSIWQAYIKFITYIGEMRDIYHSVPFIYGKCMPTLHPEKFPFYFPLLDGVSTQHWWTTSLIGVHMMVAAFPDAQVYTTNIAGRIHTEAEAHRTVGDEIRMWKYLQSTGRVIDIMQDGQKENYSTISPPEGIRKITCGKDKIIVNEEKKMCKLVGRQEFGKLLYLTPDKIGISWLVSGSTWEGKKKGTGYVQK